MSASKCTINNHAHTHISPPIANIAAALGFAKRIKCILCKHCVHSSDVSARAIASNARRIIYALSQGFAECPHRPTIGQSNIITPRRRPYRWDARTRDSISKLIIILVSNMYIYYMYIKCVVISRSVCFFSLCVYLEIYINARGYPFDSRLWLRARRVAPPQVAHN